MRVRFTRSIPKPAPPEPAGAYPVALLAIASVVMLGLAVVTRGFGWDPSPLTWYLARASGVSLYLVLWASTVLGLGLTTHLFDQWLTRSLVFSLHTYLTLLSFSFLGLHLLALALDSYTAFSMAELLIPFRTGSREPWTGIGVIAAWLLLIITISFPLRAITGYQFWRKAHWLTLPLMVIGFLHGVGAGTDTGTPPMAIVYVSTVTIALFLVAYRILRGGRARILAIPRHDRPLDRLTERSPRKAGYLADSLDVKRQR